MVDPIIETLVDALKRAISEPGEQRLFKSGKLPGLFPGRGGHHSKAAVRAVDQGLLEVVRRDVKGKTTTEWVRITPRGVDFLHEHESPVKALEDLRQLLQVTGEGVPCWLAQMQQQLQALDKHLVENVQRWTQRLESLSQGVEEALRRADAGRLPNGLADLVPWALEALTYLDRRRVAGLAGNCSLPELFAALRERHPELSIQGFHDGLRRLHDRRALHLLPFGALATELPEPEYALLDGATVLYYATR